MNININIPDEWKALKKQSGITWKEIIKRGLDKSPAPTKDPVLNQCLLDAVKSLAKAIELTKKGIKP